MRLASMIPRLTAPKIINTDTLPLFGSICSLSSDSSSEADGNSSLLSSISNAVSLTGLFESATTKNSFPRAIYIGEQHHQPKVLSAQLQIIHELFQSCQETKNIHVVMEHWSLSDQPSLNIINSQSADHLDTQALTDENDSTSEGFSASHYITIVKLVRELGGKVWAGFPPRPWARLVSKAEDDTIFDQVRSLDQERYNSQGGDEKANNIISPLPHDAYRYIENVSWPHRTYLKSMFNPDKRPMIPINDVQKGSPPLEKRGFAAAQALKDTFFAHVISEILKSDPNNIVIAIAGLGHCEWSFGAPERVEGTTEVQSFLIITKPVDVEFWSDSITSSSSTSLVLSPEWQRKQADAIVLYEWVD